MSDEARTAEIDALAERIDAAMRDHAYSHTISNSPHNFSCNPGCVSEQLRRVVRRELTGWTRVTPPEEPA